jgi:hypothetical protein
MANYSDGTTNGSTRRGGTWGILLIFLLIAAGIAGILFATGFWSAQVTKSGSLPTVSVNAKGGDLPQVDLQSKKIVVGTKETSVDVPTVATKKETIAVPEIGVKSADSK